jgi:hypothetical protein
MSITFHCEHCGKKIEAQDSAGGKWGKCPACHKKLYVPKPDAGGDEELRLAPIDETEEERKKRLLDETRRLTQDILSEKEALDGTAGGPVPEFQSDKQQLVKNIIAYLRSMADGELDNAEMYARLILPFGSKAKKVLDEIAVSEIPEPELADIPSQVLAGLIREFRTRIK